MIKLTIDGREVEVREGTLLVEAAAKAGIAIPTLCHHAELAPTGACRVCLVELRSARRARYVTACSFAAKPGLEIHTDSPPVRQMRAMLLELLLAQAPKARDVQRLAERYGVQAGRFPSPEPDNDCHLCGLCIRTCDEIVGARALAFGGRGASGEVFPPAAPDLERCIGCGACTFVCPTGHIRAEREALEHFRKHEPARRACRWALLGVVAQQVCSKGFDCPRCEIDQGMAQRFGTHPAFVVKPARKRQPQPIGPFLFASDRAYHPGHVWARRDGNVVLVGIDDFARRLLGRIDEIRAAGKGERVEVGVAAFEVASGARRTRLVAPVGGMVVESNPLLEDDPGLAVRDPYGRGWVLAIDTADGAADLRPLLSGEGARAWLAADVGRLKHKLGVDIGLNVGEGDGAVEMAAALTDKDWATVARAFFLA